MNEYVIYVARSLLTILLKEDATSEEIEMWFAQIGNDNYLGHIHKASKRLSDLCWQEIKRRRDG